MGIPTLISTNTHAVGSSTTTSAFTSGIDSTYDEYMFVFTDINPDTDNAQFRFQVNAAGASGYNETITSTSFAALHGEDGADGQLGYDTSLDLAEATGYQSLTAGIGNGADECCAGILHLFSPSNTTYVKNFYARISMYEFRDDLYEYYTAGYINTTTAIDDIAFSTNNGDFSGVIQMYGIA